MFHLELIDSKSNLSWIDFLLFELVVFVHLNITGDFFDKRRSCMAMNKKHRIMQYLKATGPIAQRCRPFAVIHVLLY